MDIKNTYFGFTDNLKAMTRAKVENTLNNLTRYKGIIYTDKEFIYIKLKEGALPEIERDYSYYSSKLNDYTKPKDDYRLTFYDAEYKTNCFNSINKTMYDYAVYLIKNDFLNEQKANNYIIAEQNKIEAEKQAKAEQEQREKEEQEQKEKEKIDFDNWFIVETEKYNNTDKISIIKEIFLNEIGSFHNRSIGLLVLIDNFDNANCKEKLKDWLSYYNTASLKTFYHITGIKLGNTDKDIQKKLDNITSKDFTGIIAYKKRVERTETEQEIYYKCNRDGIFEECRGEYIRKYGFDLFLTKTHNNYTLTEGKSGGLICSGSTKAELINSFDKLISNRGLDTFNNMVNQFINRFGISPKYKTLESVV